MSPSPSDLAIDLRDHNICFVVPQGATITDATINLPGGALVHGRLTGKIHCQSGSLIIAAGGEFSGQIEADRIYIEGRVLSPASGKLSCLKGRSLVAISENADGCAHLFSKAFAIHTRRFSATFSTLSD